MYIHLEDWTHPLFISQIEEKGVPHRNKLLKIFSSPEDPRKFLVDKSELKVTEISGELFDQEEIYYYQDRGKYRGEELERTTQDLQLGMKGQEVLRSLFRFANTEVPLIPNIMAMQENGMWVFDHPFDEIDGIQQDKRFRGDKESQIHIDVFHPSSIEIVEDFVNIHDEGKILGYREGQMLRRTLSIEGNHGYSKEK